MAFGWLKKVASSAGRGLSSIAHTAASGVSGGVKLAASGVHSVENLASKVPIVGPGIHGTLMLTFGPFELAAAVINGDRIDKAALANFKNQVSAVREVAPYAKLIVANVPAIGPGVAGAIAAGSALASGEPIGPALLKELANIVPGGAIGKAVFDLSVQVAQGKSLKDAALQTAIRSSGLPAEAQRGLNILSNAAQGKNVSKELFDEARRYMPAVTQKAFDIAVAVNVGMKMQKDIVNQLKQADLGTFASKGMQIASKPVLQSIAKTFGDQEKRGYYIGLGLLSHSGINSEVLKVVGNRLNPREKTGFAAAGAAQVGAVMGPRPPKGLSNGGAAGWITAHGLVGADIKLKTAVLKPLASHPETRSGLAAGAHSVQVRRSLLHRLLVWMGFAKAA